MQQKYSVQEWLPFQKILNNGIIKIENNLYIKIIEIVPINFNLKSELEKEAILNSYKIFLKTCNFDIQILIQSNKEDLSKHISKINSQKNIEKENIKKISENYIEYIKELNDNYYKIKECLARCGNIVKDIPEKRKIIELLYSFVNRRIYSKEN